ncbi:Trm112 family protein [Poriferisphaera sp. WC338]|uniref:Trm112 family protein n=1 Tax=Poriferisphaera sp. WC338 TaxID=3425129 RepID=UPI003D818F3B
MPHTFDSSLLDILVCPLTRSPLTLAPDGNHLLAQKGGLQYPIRDGMPILLPEQALLPLGCTSLDEFKAKHKDIIPE